jgi:hypothetical protein
MMKAVLACITAALLVVGQQADAHTVLNDVIDHTANSDDHVGNALGAAVALGVSNGDSAVTRELLTTKPVKKKKKYVIKYVIKYKKKKGKKGGAALLQIFAELMSSRCMLSTITYFQAYGNLKLQLSTISHALSHHSHAKCCILEPRNCL